MLENHAKAPRLFVRGNEGEVLIDRHGRMTAILEHGAHRALDLALWQSIWLVERHAKSPY